MTKETILGDSIVEDFSMKMCCNKCGFPIDIPRKPVLLTDNILSLLKYNDNVCKSCGHQSDGSTIPVVYQHLQDCCNKFITERDQLIKFFRHYNRLTLDERKEVCIELPRFMKPNYKSTGNIEEDDMLEPYSWKVVYLEVIQGTQLGRTMIRDIDWNKVVR